jgi:predicted Zn-dependent protease
MLRPDDMDLQTELKNLGAMDTMDAGRYSEGGSFRASIRDMARQQELLNRDKDVRDLDVMERNIALAESEFQADPNESGKLMKLVEALVRTERNEHENRAIQLLDEAFQRTKQFRFRHNLGRIRLTQLRREEQNLRMELQSDPNDEELQQSYRQFARKKAEEELAEYTLWAENYPTDMGFRYELAQRLFVLGRYSDAIPVFQTARQDPKYRIVAGILLGRAFLEAGFVDEAIDTLKGCIDEYLAKGDPRSKDMHYWYARALELKGDIQAALRNYSQVAQWDFNYRDVQTRIKQLRSSVQQA